MKLKYIITLILISLIVFLIYILNLDTKTYYLNIEDKEYSYNKYVKENIKDLEKYVNIYEHDYRITDLIRDIEDNKKINKNQTIQNALIKADLITIKMGDNELDYKVNTSQINELFDYCDELIKDMDNLFKIIRNFSKEKIYFIGLYNNHSPYYDEIYKFLNLKIKDMCDDYDIIYIEIGNIEKEIENVKISTKIK